MYIIMLGVNILRWCPLSICLTPLIQNSPTGHALWHFVRDVKDLCLIAETRKVLIGKEYDFLKVESILKNERNKGIFKIKILEKALTTGIYCY